MLMKRLMNCIIIYFRKNSQKTKIITLYLSIILLLILLKRGPNPNRVQSPFSFNLGGLNWVRKGVQLLVIRRK